MYRFYNSLCPINIFDWCPTTDWTHLIPITFGQLFVRVSPERLLSYFKIQLGQVSIVLTVHYFPIMDTFPDSVIALKCQHSLFKCNEVWLT